MAENKLKERWKAGKAAVNGWLAIPSGFSAEVMAQRGWDSVTVDMQHGVQDYQTMVQCFQAMDRLPVTKLVRGRGTSQASSGRRRTAAPMDHLPDGEYPRAGPGARFLLPVPAVGATQQRTGPRRDVRRRQRLPEDR
jgi:hypothetical protein